MLYYPRRRAYSQLCEEQGLGICPPFVLQERVFHEMEKASKDKAVTRTILAKIDKKEKE